MNATQTRAEQRPDVVVWIDERHALIARCDPEGQISTVEIRRLARPENRYLGQVVHEINGRGRVMLIGAPPIRLALERRFVAVSHRPDRLLPAPPRARVFAAKIVDRLDRLAA